MPLQQREDQRESDTHSSVLRNQSHLRDTTVEKKKITMTASADSSRNFVVLHDHASLFYGNRSRPRKQALLQLKQAVVLLQDSDDFACKFFSSSFLDEYRWLILFS